MVSYEKKYPFTSQDVDKRGNVRNYFRRYGRKIRIKARVGTPEYEAKYYELLAKNSLNELSPSNAESESQGTWKWLCKQYMASTEWQELDPIHTQRPRRGILESTWAEPIEPGSPNLIGDCPIARMSPQIVRVLRDRKAKYPNAANHRVKFMRVVFKWAIETDRATTNPARDVPFLKTSKTGIHSWTEDECEQFENRWPVGTKERLAFALLRYLGVRRSDVVRLGRQHVKDGAIIFKVRKGRKNSPRTLELPVHPELQRIINATASDGLTFLKTEYGRAFAEAGFGNWFRERCDIAGLPQCSAHGLRKAAAAAAAENGATASELQGWFGWLSIAEAERYTRDASQRRLAKNVAPMIRRG